MIQHYSYDDEDVAGDNAGDVAGGVARCVDGRSRAWSKLLLIWLTATLGRQIRFKCEKRFCVGQRLAHTANV